MRRAICGVLRDLHGAATGDWLLDGSGMVDGGLSLPRTCMDKKSDVNVNVNATGLILF